MDGVLLDAVTKRCIGCHQELAVYHRVLGGYRAGELFSSDPGAEVGLFVGNARPLLQHVSCQDPTLATWKMQPVLHNCIKCRKALQKADAVQPVFGVQDAVALNPHDPTDVGLTLGDRIYFIHVDCKNPGLGAGNGLLVKL